MNGRVDYIVTEEEINLTRGPSGKWPRPKEPATPGCCRPLS
uniref:Synaptojanin 2 binding protein n=1 Tax=Cricetulus griseus TaxID=10029 RepID=A0A8C2QJP5_CRIGR